MISIIGYMVFVIGGVISSYVFSRALSVKLEDNQGFAKLAWFMTAVAAGVGLIVLLILAVALDSQSGDIRNIGW